MEIIKNLIAHNRENGIVGKRIIWSNNKSKQLEAGNRNTGVEAKGRKGERCNAERGGEKMWGKVTTDKSNAKA